jgi:hypothetical protein
MDPEDGGDTFSETSVRTRATRYKFATVSIIDIAVETFQRTVFIDHKILTGPKDTSKASQNISNSYNFLLER